MSPLPRAHNEAGSARSQARLVGGDVAPGLVEEARRGLCVERLGNVPAAGA